MQAICKRRQHRSHEPANPALVQLSRNQNACSTAARVVTAADVMLQTIIGMKR